MRILFLVLFFLCCFCSLVVPIGAIHEDEQGLRDWILRFVGHVEHTAFHPGLEPNSVFVTSTQGVVAAVSLTDGGLRWRRLFSEAQVCVAAGKQEVLVASRNGTVSLLDPGSGAMRNSLKLRLPTGARVGACTVEKRGATVAVMGVSSVYLYKFSLKTEDEVVKASSEFPIGTDAHALRISGEHLWVVRSAGADRYSLAGTVEVTGVAAEGGADAVAPLTGGTAAVFSKTKITVVRDAKNTENIPCVKCGVGVLVGASGVFGGVVTTKANKDGFTVSFPTSAVHVPYQPSATVAPTVLLALQGNGVDGARVILRAANGHLLAVSEKLGKLWERAEGLAHLAAIVIADNSVQEDYFAFRKVALAVSLYGAVYTIPVSEMGHGIRVLADVADVICQKLAADSMASVKIEQLVLSGTNTVSVIASSSSGGKVTVVIDTITGALREVKVHADILVVTPTFEVTRLLKIHGNVSSSNMHFFIVNASSGLIEGYVVSTSSVALPLWTVRMPSSLIAYATGEDALRTTFVNQLRVFPNKTSTTEEVYRKYPTRNLLVVAHYEPSAEELTTLVITAIDTITGSMLTTVRHRNVEGPVHMLVVENNVFYHFMDVEKMRHCLGVWEMFEQEMGHVIRKDAGATLPLVITSFFSHGKRKFSSRASRPPLVTAAVLGMQGGNVAAMGVTTSFSGIARKSVVFAFESGRIATVEVDKLLAGGQIPLDDKGKQVTHVIIPSTSLASHKFRAAKPRIIATKPTNLESSCHVLVAGLDMFYARVSSGKAFDLLNSDFNKNLLITLTCGFGVLTLIARYLVSRKTLGVMWR